MQRCRIVRYGGGRAGGAMRCDGSDRSVVQVYPSPTVHTGAGGDRPGGDLEGVGGLRAERCHSGGAEG